MDNLAEIRRRLLLTRPHLTDDDISAVVHEVRRAISMAGGASKSAAKSAAVRANLAKAREKRWPKKVAPVANSALQPTQDLKP